MANVSLLSSGLPAPQKGLSKARKTAEKALVYKLLKSINKIPTSYKDYLFKTARAKKEIMRNLQTNRQNENPLQKGLLRKGMKNHSGNQKKTTKL